VATNINDKIIASIDIEDVVQKILNDLNVNTQVAEVRSATTKNINNTNNKTDKVDKISETNVVGELREDEVLFDGGRVISLEYVRNKFDKIHVDKITTVVVPPSCILTPSAKDEIKKHKLEIIVRKINVNNFPLWMALHGNITASNLLIKQLQSEYELSRIQLADLSGIVDEALRVIGQNKFGIILTKHPATVLRATGLYEPLRVIIAIDPKQVAIDAKEIDANLMIIPPARINETNIFESVRNFCRTEKNNKKAI
jgi:hypothetical protein